MRVMNGLVMTLEEDEIFICLAALLCEQFCRFANEGAKISSPTSWDHFFLSVFSSSEVLGKITSIRSKLPTAACWSLEEKRGNCEANLLYATSVHQPPQTNHSQCSSPVEALNLIVESKSQPVELVIRQLSYMYCQGERKACIHIVLWILMSLL